MKKKLSVTRTSTKIIEIEVEIPDTELATTPYTRMRQFREKALEQAHDTDFSNGSDFGEVDYDFQNFPRALDW